MNMSTNNGFSCRFNGGCGSNFNSETEYLRHVIRHLSIRGTTCTEIVEGFREQSKALTQNLFSFDCLIPQRIFAAYNRLKARSHPVPLQQSLEANYPFGSINRPLGRHSYQENPATYPVYEMVLHGFQSQEDDLIPSSSSLVSMYDVLPFVNPNVEQGNVFSPKCESSSKIGSVKWNEILENYPSAVDGMRLDQITDTAAGNTQHETEKPSPIPKQCLKPSGVSTEVEKISSDECILSDREGRKSWFDIRGEYFPLPKNSGNLRPLQPIQWPSLAAYETPSFRYTGSNFNGMSNKCYMKPHVTAHKHTTKVVVPATRKRTAQNDFSVPGNRKPKRKEIANHEYYSSAYILQEGLKKKKAPGVLQVKPYVCPVPKCGKSYKNKNGIKYHAKYGHSAPKEFPCHCGKLYNTVHSLLAHQKTHNPTFSSESSAEDGYTSSSDSSERESSNTGESEDDCRICRSPYLRAEA